MTINDGPSVIGGLTLAASKNWPKYCLKLVLILFYSCLQSMFDTSDQGWVAINCILQYAIQNIAIQQYAI